MINDKQTILYLHDGDMPGVNINVRVTGGLRSNCLAKDLQFIERQARLIIEQYKGGEWSADESPKMPRGMEEIRAGEVS